MQPGNRKRKRAMAVMTVSLWKRFYLIMQKFPIDNKKTSARIFLEFPRANIGFWEEKIPTALKEAQYFFWYADKVMALRNTGLNVRYV